MKLEAVKMNNRNLKKGNTRVRESTIVEVKAWYLAKSFWYRPITFSSWEFLYYFF